MTLVGVMLAGALIRQSFVLRHAAKAHGRQVPWEYALIGVLVLAGVFFWLRPTNEAAPVAGATPVTQAEVQPVIAQRCVMCHNAPLANKNVQLHTPELVAKHAQEIYQQAVVMKLMPLNNATQMTDAERALLRQWFEGGAKP